MDLIIDTTGVEFQVAKPFEARMDRERDVQRRDKQGGTNLPLWAVQLVAWTEAGSETLMVTVPAENAPKVTQKQFVKVDGLQAMPLVNNRQMKGAFLANAVVG